MSAPAMSVDMRHTKLSAEDAALIAGEVVKPQWASRNEGIHERISFDDTLWGFELAGGAYYKTPLRVVHVKQGSRAEQACIRAGDTVLRINDIDTSTLTLKQAHDIVLESGIHLRIAVTSPDDDVDAYYTYEDAIADEARLAEELRRAREAERIRRAIERAQRSCNLPWPWVRRKMIIYRESNCFLVPSSYESKHKEKYPELPHVRYTDDICEFNRGTQIEPKPIRKENKENGPQKKMEPQPIENSDTDFDNQSNVMDEKEQNKIIDEILEENEEEEVENKNSPSDIDETTHSDIETFSDMNGEVLGPDNEEDGSPVTENDEAKIKEELDEVKTEADRLAEDTEIDNIDDIQNQNESHGVEEIETETNESNIPSLREENLDNEEDAVAPTSNFVDDGVINSEEDNIDVDKSEEGNVEGGVEEGKSEEDNIVNDKNEEDSVVDGIIGDGLDDSTNER